MLCGHLEHVILVVPCRAVPYLTKRRMKLHAFLAQGLAYSVRRVGVDVTLSRILLWNAPVIRIRTHPNCSAAPVRLYLHCYLLGPHATEQEFPPAAQSFQCLSHQDSRDQAPLATGSKTILVAKSLPWSTL